MTTPAEKRALDAIFAALDLATSDQKPRTAVTNKLALLFGIAVYLCRDHGIPIELAREVLADRWDQYSETFGDADAS
jgi:hypothetical protein